MMSEFISLDYRSMSLSEMAAGLEETSCYQFINAGETELEPLVEALELVTITSKRAPSPELVTRMERLYEFESNKCPRVSLPWGLIPPSLISQSSPTSRPISSGRS